MKFATKNLIKKLALIILEDYLRGQFKKKIRHFCSLLNSSQLKFQLFKIFKNFVNLLKLYFSEVFRFTITTKMSYFYQ